MKVYSGCRVLGLKLDLEYEVLRVWGLFKDLRFQGLGYLGCS